MSIFADVTVTFKTETLYMWMGMFNGAILTAVYFKAKEKPVYFKLKGKRNVK